MAWGAMVALALAANAGGSGSETELGLQKSTGTRLYAKVVGERLVLRSLGPANIQAAYGIDMDADGKIGEKDLYYTVQKDGSLCTGHWYPARKALDCDLASKATGSQETIGPQVLRRLEIPLDEVAPVARVLRIMLMMDRPGGGNDHAWASYDLVTGEVKGLAVTPSQSAATATATAATAPAGAAAAKPATTQPALPPACPPTLAALSKATAGRPVTYRKNEVRFTQVSGFSLMPEDGEDHFDPKSWPVLGVTPLRIYANVRDGQHKGLFASLPGHDIARYEAAFRAQFAGKGTMRCDTMECRWLLVPYPQKAPKGVLGDASLSLYNLTKDETWLFCKYGE